VALRCRARDVRFPDSDVRFLIQLRGVECSCGRTRVGVAACLRAPTWRGLTGTQLAPDRVRHDRAIAGWGDGPGLAISGGGERRPSLVRRKEQGSRDFRICDATLRREAEGMSPRERVSWKLWTDPTPVLLGGRGERSLAGSSR